MGGKFSVLWRRGTTLVHTEAGVIASANWGEEDGGKGRVEL